MGEKSLAEIFIDELKLWNFTENIKCVTDKPIGWKSLKSWRKKNIYYQSTLPKHNYTYRNNSSNGSNYMPSKFLEMIEEAHLFFGGWSRVFAF